jgi:Transcriptional Coactivator p15 (PC4)
MNAQADLRGFRWLETSGREPLAAYESDYKGQPYFHIRRMYLDAGGIWQPSRQGITCKAADKAALLQALGDYIQAQRYANVPA